MKLNFHLCTIEQAKAMKTYKHKAGVTLVEMLIVVAIIALLATMVIGIASRIDTQGKERLAENTFALLNAALGQFRDYGYRHKDYSVYSGSYERDFYRSLVFPVDCNDFSKTNLETALKNALDATSVTISSGVHEDEYSGSEALHFFLSKVPGSRETLDKIDRSLITDIGSDGVSMEIRIDGKGYPLMRIIDPWGETLRYDYYDEDAPNFKKMKESKRNFPLITSAGPDKIFNTADDITNR